MHSGQARKLGGAHGILHARGTQLAHDLSSAINRETGIYRRQFRAWRDYTSSRNFKVSPSVRKKRPCEAEASAIMTSRTYGSGARRLRPRCMSGKPAREVARLTR